MAVQLLDQLLVDIIDDLGGGEVQGLVRAANRAMNELARRHLWRHYQSETSITLLAKYATGTVTLTEGDETVTGDSTVFTSTMEGYKFRSGGSVFTIASYTSPTEIELDVPWPYDTVSEQTYEIYQDVYSMPSTMRRLLYIVDAVTAVPWCEKTHMDKVRDWSGYVLTDAAFKFPESAWPYKFAQFGIDDSGNLEINVNSLSDSDRVVDVFYYRWPTALTKITDTPDIAEHMEEAFYQMTLRYFISRMPQHTQESYMARQSRMAQVNGDLQKAFKEALAVDATLTRPMQRNKRVLF